MADNLEEWRSVPGYESIYEVSSLGNVRRLPSKRALKPSRHRTGYFLVVLCRFNKHRTIYVHTLVLNAFVGQRQDGFVACHNNGDRLDNRLSNLRWDTQRGNLLDRKSHGTSFDCERNPSSKLTRRQALKLAGLHLPAPILAKAFGISTSSAWAVSRQSSWKELHHGK